MNFKMRVKVTRIHFTPTNFETLLLPLLPLSLSTLPAGPVEGAQRPAAVLSNLLKPENHREMHFNALLKSGERFAP